MTLPVVERRRSGTRRRTTRSGRRATDPRPLQRLKSDPAIDSVVNALIERVEGIEKALEIQLQRIAELHGADVTLHDVETRQGLRVAIRIPAA